jgi:hypothetical protein
MLSRKGSQERLWQKSVQMDHEVLVDVCCPVEMALVAASLIVPNSLRRLSVPVGSQASRVAELANIVEVGPKVFFFREMKRTGKKIGYGVSGARGENGINRTVVVSAIKS